MFRLCNILIVSVLIVSPEALCAADPQEKEPPDPFSKEVASAWEKAGFKVGWCEGFAFRAGDTKPQPGWVPAFQAPEFDYWEEGQMKALPTPQKPFGLNLTPTALSDNDFKDLTRFKTLTVLNVTNSVSDTSMKEVAKLDNLISLGLGGAQVTDAGLKEIADHQRLAELNIRVTPITDVGLKELAKLKQLTKLTYGSSEVTEAGVAKLKKALPKCKIEF